MVLSLHNHFMRGTPARLYPDLELEELEMRNAIIAALLVLLSACGLLPGIGGQQVSGGFQGNWNTGVDQSKLRLTLVGLGASGGINYDNQQEIKDPNITRAYALELPSGASEGSYQVAAYSDDNANSKFDATDNLLGSTCSKFLLFSGDEGNKSFFVGTPGSVANLSVKKGWNGYDSKIATSPTNPFQGESYPAYNLYRIGSCP